MQTNFSSQFIWWIALNALIMWDLDREQMSNVFFS